jgi:peptidyl-prolyl cis-trans isomerase SurA
MERFTEMKRCLPNRAKNLIPRLPLLLLVLTLLGGTATAKRRVLDKSVVTINDEVILQSDIEKFQKKLKSKSYQELFGGVDEGAADDPKKVLGLLIEEKIINQQVKRLELSASDQEVEGHIKSVLKRNGISDAQLAERLKTLGSTMDEYREGIKRQIERKNLIEREIKPQIESSASDEQLRHYYLQSASTSGDSDQQYKIAHLFIENKKKAGVAPQERAKTIYKELLAHPENFDKAVKEYSDDATTSENGGLLGFFPVSQLAKEFRSVVPKTPVGQVTAPIKTPGGFHVIKVLETKAGGDYAALPKEKKEELRNELMQQELERRMGQWLERKKSEAYIRMAGGKETTDANKN